MKKIFLVNVFLCVFLVAFAQSDNVHYDISPKYTHDASPEEQALIPLLGQKIVRSQAPVAPVTAIAEFQPMGGVMVRYPLGVPVALVRELSKITQVKVIISPDQDSLGAKSFFSYYGVDMSNVQFWSVDNDSYWVRDYGPWFIIDGNDSVRIVDFTYNRPRPNDDDAIEKIAEIMNVKRYEMPMVHTGGNYMVDGYGTAASTMLVEQENSDETASSLQEIANNYLGINNYMFLIDPLGEYIAHIDCWGKFLDVDKVIIGKVPASDPRYQNYELVAETFAQSTTPWGNKYHVYRVYSNPDPNPYFSSTATPYTNSLIVNDHVFVPVTGNSHDNEAINVYEEAMPGYTIVPIMTSDYTPWLNTDALHCRTHELADLGMLYIKHYPLLGKKQVDDNLKISAIIKPLSGELLINDSVTISYRINNDDWQSQAMESEGENVFSFDFSTLELNEGDSMAYFISAQDESGRKENHPYIGAPDPHVFFIENDGEVGIDDAYNFNFKVFPNPATSSLFVSSNSDEIESIYLYDSNGRNCNYSAYSTGPFVKIDVSPLAQGVYFILILDKNGKKHYQKVVKY